MTAPRGVGILGIGMYMPPEVRRNDWWPPEVVARWVAQRHASPPRLPAVLSDGARRILQAHAEQADDPFLGTVERRVRSPTWRSAPPGMRCRAPASLRPRSTCC
jgi:hypothetical protein